MRTVHSLRGQWMILTDLDHFYCCGCGCCWLPLASLATPAAVAVESVVDVVSVGSAVVVVDGVVDGVVHVDVDADVVAVGADLGNNAGTTAAGLRSNRSQAVVDALDVMDVHVHYDQVVAVAVRLREQLLLLLLEEDTRPVLQVGSWAPP